MNLPFPVEQRLLEAIRSLPPDKQAAVLDFAEFLQSRQRDRLQSSQVEATSATEVIGGSVNLAERGIDVTRAADLSFRLQPFTEDWNRPEMAIYDEL